MRSLQVAALGFFAIGSLAACATGVQSADALHKDGGVLFKDGAPSHDGATPPQDDGGTPTCTTGTLCGAACVDTQSDPNNCGGCGVPCAPTETCQLGACTPSSSGSNEPPVGTCAHSLCTAGSMLSEGCDPAGCSIVICDPSYLADTFCCDTSWDSTCVSEVTTYCAPYACP
jgi:hypothetical protein